MLITSHRYSQEYDYAKTSGKYCVQFLTIVNDALGRRILNDWRNDCLRWCFARYENGKFGDQMYLDAWPLKYEGVHELQHLGGGVAPWNVQQYDISRRSTNGNLILREKRKPEREFALVFYHFHGIKMFNAGLLSFNSYELSPRVKRLLYWPYIAALHENGLMVKALASGLDPHGVQSCGNCHSLSVFALAMAAARISIKHFLKILPDLLKAIQRYKNSYPIHESNRTW